MGSHKSLRLLLFLLSFAPYKNFGMVAPAQYVRDIVYYFAHGLRGNATRWNYPQFQGIFPHNCRVLAADGPDWIEEPVSQSISLQKINSLPVWKRFFARLYREFVLIKALRRSTMAQHEDQNRVITCISQAQRSPKNCVYVGHSKGAALGANLLQTHQFKGAILIAPFCDANKAFRDFPPISYLPHGRFIDNYFVPFLRYFLLPQYDSNGQQPLHFRKDSPNVISQTPILIVSIKNDAYIPQYHQVELYIKLKETDHNVYFYELESADHDKLGWGPHNRAHQKFVEVITAFQRYIETGQHQEACPYASPTVEEICSYYGSKNY